MSVLVHSVYVLDTDSIFSLLENEGSTLHKTY